MIRAENNGGRCSVTLGALSSGSGHSCDISLRVNKGMQTWQCKKCAPILGFHGGRSPTTLVYHLLCCLRKAEIVGAKLKRIESLLYVFIGSM